LLVKIGKISIFISLKIAQMYVSFSKTLLSLILKPDATLGSVLKLFANYLGAEHYLLLELPVNNSPYFTITSDVVGIQIPANEIHGNFVGTRFDVYEPCVTYAGLDGVHSILYVPINDKLLIVLINPTSTTPPDDVLQSTQSAILYLYSICPFDIDFSLSVVCTYTDKEMVSLAKRSFSVGTFHPSQLFVNTFAYFVCTGISERLGVDPRELFKFMISIRSHYNDVLYHNWFHALDVVQFVYMLYKSVHFECFLTDLEVFALFVAAICHDTGHNGLNNNFHRNAKTLFVRLAQNLPPLEHYHYCISCGLLHPLLASLSETDCTIIMQFLINCIMATDMEQHKTILESWSAILGDFNRSNPAHRLLLAQMIIKAADLSNVVRDFSEAERMSKRFVAEMHRQGKIEIELGLPISPMCDPNDQTPLCVGQIGFYSFVAGPLMKELHAFFPDVEGNLKQFNKNLARWNAMKAEWEARHH
jgi:hypothetical protein